MMHLLIGAKPGLLSTFFSLVKKRLCSPELKHCLNVYSVVLCTLGCCVLGHFKDRQQNVQLVLMALGILRSAIPLLRLIRVLYTS